MAFMQGEGQQAQQYGQRGLGIDGMNMYMMQAAGGSMQHPMMQGGSGDKQPTAGGPIKGTLIQEGEGQFYSRLLAPYFNPAMHMNQKRGKYSSPGPAPNMQQPFPPTNTPQYGGEYGGRPNFQSQYQSQQMGFVGGGMPAGAVGAAVPVGGEQGGSGAMRQTTPSYPGQYQGYGAAVMPPQVASGVVAPGGSGDGFTPQERTIYQHSPKSGNPTLSLMPANFMSPYLPDSRPSFNEMLKLLQVLSQKDGELWLTFSIPDGIILPPFKLEYNTAVNNYVFQLKPTVHQTLMHRSELELQLKCFHHEDREKNTNWPANVRVSVNAIPLSIEGGENKTSHEPLYLKDVCHAGRNTIQIAVTACCCTHLFVLELVQRANVRTVMHFLQKRLRKICIEKNERNFNNTFSGGSSYNCVANDVVEETALKRRTLPNDCERIQCSDLESYLQVNCKREAWISPDCNKPAQLEVREVDQYMRGIPPNSFNTSQVEVTIDPSANWKPSRGFQGYKTVDGDTESCNSKRINKPMSLGSMTLPTMNNSDMGQSMSPYIPPDMNSIASGSMMNSSGPPHYPASSSTGCNGAGNGTSGINTAGSGYEFSSGGTSSTSDFNSTPMSHLNDTSPALDPLTDIEKFINEQLFADNIEDPTEILSFLDPPNLATPPAAEPALMTT